MFMVRSNQAFSPSGMYKSSTSVTIAYNTWTKVTGWTADTANYPGTTIVSDGLVAQSAKTGATVSAQVTWAQHTNTVSVRIKQNGTVIVTGASSTNGTSTASVSVNVAAGDNFTIEVDDTNINGTDTTVTTGTTSFVHLT